MFTSLERHYRGFTYKQEYPTVKLFNESMKKQLNGKDEVNWSYLFNEDGKMVASYKRGMVSVERH